LDYLCSFSYTSNYRFVLTPGIEHSLRHTWALSVEEQFYLLLPWLLVAFQKDLRKVTYLLIATIALVDVYRMVLFFHLDVSDRWLTFAFDSRVDHLLVGSLLAVLLKRGALMRFWNFLAARTWTSIISFGLIVLSIALAFRFHLAYKYAVGFVMDPLLTAVFLVQVIAMGRTWLWGWLNWRVTRYLGQISYAMFLYHMLANKLVFHVLGDPSLWIRVPVVVAVSALLGAASFHLVERRFLRLKSRFTKAPAKEPVLSAIPSFQLANG
jgi:peptidoglycan/LPS O-acetylase OafA/YrhL